MKNIFVAVGLSLLALVLAGVFIATPQAQANAPITVNSTLDEVDATPGDGQCVSTPSGQCTLRAAIMEANALTGTDTINVPAGTYSLTIVGSNEDFGLTGDLDIRSAVTINGAGATQTYVDAQNIDRVFQVHLITATATISGVTIQRGNAGIFLGGGLLNSGTLLLSDSSISGNTNVGISNGGTLALTRCEVVSNTVYGVYNSGAWASIYDSLVNGNSGGGLYNSGRMGLVNSIVSGNMAGGLYNTNTGLPFHQLVLTNTTVVSNTGTSNGGGIYNGGTLRLVSSAVMSNTTTNDGGGIYVFTLSRTTLVNTTISGNRANSNGGGLVFASGGYAPPDLYNVTLTNNVADNNNDGTGDGGGIYNSSLLHEPISLTNTLLAGNIDVGGQSPDCMGEIWPQDYNLIQSTAGCMITGTATHNVIGQTPMLGPLQDNGGSTLTHALLAGSPAIDAGDPAGCKDALGNLLLGDQRNFIRTVDGDGNGSTICDIGAFEYGSTPFLQLFLPLILR